MMQMTHFIEIFYNYILPPIALFSVFYIIYLLLTREKNFRLMERHFYDTIEKNSAVSNEAIQKHFTNMQEYSKEALQALDTDARQELYKTLSIFDSINKNYESIASQLNELQRANAFLSNEIKKRDAIVERKTKQIEKFKNGEK